MIKDDYEGSFGEVDLSSLEMDGVYPNKIHIDEDYQYNDNNPELEVGMKVLHKDSTAHGVIAWLDKYRDNAAVLYDPEGHSNWVADIYSGDYYFIPKTVAKMKVLFGSSVTIL